MKFTRTGVYNIENSIRGMRNPLSSWEKSDTGWYPDTEVNAEACEYQYFATEGDETYFKCIGPDDLKLAKKLIAAGPEHAKFLRQIIVSVDITAPLYWWKEMDQYKIGPVTNSTSTIHTLAKTPITLEQFEIGDFTPMIDDTDDHGTFYCPVERKVTKYLEFLEELRQSYLRTKDIRYWKELIRWLPESWLQLRTWTGSYANLRTIYHQRKNHKLTEWDNFCKWIEGLPYAEQFLIN